MYALEGYLTGLAMIIFVGPVFFLLLTTALEHSLIHGLAVALGIIVSDIVCVVLCVFGISNFLVKNTNQDWVAGVGAVLLLIMGVSYFLKKGNEKQLTSKLKSETTVSLFIKGFLVNFVNPFVFMVWIGIVELGRANTTTSTELFIYLLAVLGGIFSTDVLKVFLAKKIKPLVTSRAISRVYKISGAVMVIFSIRLLVFIFS